VRRFVDHGGSVVATGETGLYNEWGEPQPDFALADLLEVHWPTGRERPSETARAQRASETLHTYLRLAKGPVMAPASTGAASTGDEGRHAVLRGFEDTDILPFGGWLDQLIVDEGALVPLTFIPPFPIYPPETSWMREPKTNIPGLVLNTRPSGGRIAYLPADIDRRFARDNLPDHGDLLANIVRWAAKDAFPLTVAGPGFIDCHLYRQTGRAILHLVNLTNAGTWRQPVHELIPVGPLTVRIKLPQDVPGRKVRLLVSGETPSFVLHAAGYCSRSSPYWTMNLQSSSNLARFLRQF